MSSTARVSVAGAAAVETVWQRYTRPALWPTWSPQIRSVEYEHPTLRPGTKRVVRTVAGSGVPFTIEEVDVADHTWSWQVVALGLRLHLVHGVRPHPTGSETWLEVTGPPVVGRAYARVATLALRRLVRAQ
ncbi:SRPBCC family protein [Janibacter cremeus]|uniref:SRPBCC family protein n=1 Tax=Janibacter cremeus TaxID=1285192 RepID=UPI0023F7C738|nr:SRPBCC family protein [Janibacter cremeus]WEV77237.1 SRPBCC family protein [Janibacter cremeus]